MGNRFEKGRVGVWEGQEIVDRNMRDGGTQLKRKIEGVY